MQTIDLNGGGWTQIATNAAVLLIQANARAELFLSDTAPGIGASGFTLEPDVPHSFGEIGLLGGGAWVRSEGSVTFATDA